MSAFLLQASEGTKGRGEVRLTRRKAERAQTFFYAACAGKKKRRKKKLLQKKFFFFEMLGLADDELRRVPLDLADISALRQTCRRMRDLFVIAELPLLRGDTCVRLEYLRHGPWCAIRPVLWTEGDDLLFEDEALRPEKRILPGDVFDWNDLRVAFDSAATPPSDDLLARAMRLEGMINSKPVAQRGVKSRRLRLQACFLCAKGGGPTPALGLHNRFYDISEGVHLAFAAPPI